MSIIDYPTMNSAENNERYAAEEEQRKANQRKKQQILGQIEKLQQTRDYADEVESDRLTKVIERLWMDYERID
jgi:hypothetical protein